MGYRQRWPGLELYGVVTFLIFAIEMTIIIPIVAIYDTI